MEPTEVQIPEKRHVTKSAFFVLISALFDKYSSAGVESILLLFFNLKLGYDRDSSTAIYHAYEFLTYGFSIIGSIIADSWLGIYKTIVLTSILCAAACILIAVSVVDVLYLPIEALSIVGLVMLTVSLGCQKPLIVTYGGQQYKPSEVKSMALYFALFYFMINIGSVTSRIVGPILRQDVKCFGNNDCFALAFGIPGICMIIMASTIMVANRYSETSQAKGTTLLNVFACMRHAIVMKIKSRKSQLSKKNHWLDYSEEKYGKILVMETRVILNVFVLYLPISVFWALFFQQGSRWLFQAARMNGSLGFYTIKPDQFNVLNPILILILIPTFEYVFHPLLLNVGIRTALQKATLGGVLAGVAFLISAIIESQIDGEYLHMAWMIPQYLVLAMGEVLIIVPMMNFCYSEAPKSMKTILQMISSLSIGLGNLIVVIVAGSRLIESQIYEFILFAVLMFVDMIIFGFLATRYKSLKQSELKGDEPIENKFDDSKTI